MTPMTERRIPPIVDPKKMTCLEDGAYLKEWSWELCRDERQACLYDWLNSLAFEMGRKVCVPRDHYPEGFPPGFFHVKPARDREQSIAQADSGYPALNP
jgi:hypothetical protein